MKKLTTEKLAHRIDSLLKELASTTQVSEQFLEAIRPSVERLFTEVPEHRQQRILEILVETVARQAETERSTARALNALNELTAKRALLTASIEALKQKITQTQGRIASTVASAYHHRNGKTAIKA